MFSFGAREKSSLAAVAAAAMLSAQSAEADLSNAALPSIAPNAAIVTNSSSSAANSARHMLPETFEGFRSIASAERETITSAGVGFHRAEALAALDKVDKAIAEKNEAELNKNMESYAIARAKFTLSHNGIAFGLIEIPATALAVFGVFGAARVRNRIEKYIYPSTSRNALDFCEKEFLDERMSTARWPVQAADRASDVLAYIWKKTGSQEAFRQGCRYQVALGVTAVVATLAIASTGAATGSFVWSTLAELAAPFLFGGMVLYQAYFSMERRAEGMIKRYQAWAETHKD